MSKEKEITKQELADALFSMLDGCKGPVEIQHDTGLSQRESEKIYNLFQRLSIFGQKSYFKFDEWKDI